ncbi:TPA: DUF3343 domain-containing protein [Candidatus Poribacteria bacterium]|nr:DUF3343 domain-containing protein [Candidatus Poribacteria bacterium]
MNKPTYGVVLFHSTQAAIKAEKILKEAEIKIKLIPVPRHLSSDCGICLRFEVDDVLAVKSTLASKNVQTARIHQL